MKKKHFKLRSEVVPYPGMGGWHFLYVAKKQSEAIKKDFAGMKRGWGSLPVMVTLGKTKWKTSIFPDKKAGVYLLPLKADVRKKEGIQAGDSVSFAIELLV
jgi:hypothetical protein